MNKFIDYYSVLGISIDTNQEEIRKAYRKLVKRYHPDLNPNNPEATSKMQLINEAYLILSDSNSRTLYNIKYKQFYNNVPPSEGRKENYKKDEQNYQKEQNYRDDQIDEWIKKARQQAKEMTDDLMSNSKSEVKGFGIGVFNGMLRSLFLIFSTLLLIYFIKNLSNHNNAMTTILENPVTKKNNISTNNDTAFAKTQPQTSEKFNINIVQVVPLPTEDVENDSQMEKFKYPLLDTLQELGKYSNSIVSYGIAYQRWPGPKSWIGSGGIGTDGNMSVMLYPNEASKEHIYVKYFSLPACIYCMEKAAAPYFPNAMEDYNRNYNINGEDPILTKDRKYITRMNDSFVRYRIPKTSNTTNIGVIFYPHGERCYGMDIVMANKDEGLAELIIDMYLNKKL